MDLGILAAAHQQLRVGGDHGIAADQ
jgi:hypothetical protein